MLDALHELESPSASVILTGDARLCGDWQRSLRREADRRVRVLNVAGVGALPAALRKGALPSAGSAVAWICVGMRCLPGIDSIDRALAEIRDAMRGGLR
jgi:hypothetical protein